MKKLWKNIVESFNMGWDNLCTVNKVLIFTFLLFPVGFNGVVDIIEGVKWLIEKF